MGSSDANVPYFGTKASIFVIDDDPDTRNMLADVLSGAGYRVQTGTSDPPSIDALMRLPQPDLLVVGLVPPRHGWDGRDAQQGTPRFAGVPVLAVREAAAIDADAFLPTPFEARGLLRAVQLFLVVAADRAIGAGTTVIDVGAVLEVSLGLASQYLVERARVTCEFDRKLRVRANPEQLCLIFLNLLLNAATSIEDGVPETNGIRVAGWRTADGRTVVEISDTGRGIAPEQLARVFEPLARRHVRPGQGISLERSQRIVKAAGGLITVTSTPGKGASFRVELPTAES